jgi:hypothetical protein
MGLLQDGATVLGGFVCGCQLGRIDREDGADAARAMALLVRVLAPFQATVCRTKLARAYFEGKAIAADGLLQRGRRASTQDLISP